MIRTVTFRPKIRAAIKWSGAVATVLLLAAWVGSAWCVCGVSNSAGTFAGISDGEIVIVWESPLSLKPFEGAKWIFGRENRFPFSWWFHSYDDPWTGVFWRTVYVPVWFPALLTGAPTLWMWRNDRRRRLRERAHACSKCGYSRTGLPVGRPCPECGALASSA